MTTRSHLDELRVVDIRRVEADRNALGWTCARCSDEHSPTKSWWATFLDRYVGPFTVALCDLCWTTTRTRLEHDAFGYAGRTR